MGMPTGVTRWVMTLTVLAWARAALGDGRTGTGQARSALDLMVFGMAARLGCPGEMVAAGPARRRIQRASHRSACPGTRSFRKGLRGG